MYSVSINSVFKFTTVHAHVPSMFKMNIFIQCVYLEKLLLIDIRNVHGLFLMVRKKLKTKQM